MLLASFAAGPLGCNCSILADLPSKQAVIVDPGGDAPRIIKKLQAYRLTVSAIVHTHAHVDHVGATAPLQLHTGAEAHIHDADRNLYRMLPVQALFLGVPVPKKAQMLGTLNDGATIRAGAVELGVMHTPGHTQGSVCFWLEDSDGPLLFSGDTLFQRGVGRTDLWGGDSRLLARSLKNRILTLPDDTRVLPGHGPPTTIGEERELNPHLQDL